MPSKTIFRLGSGGPDDRWIVRESATPSGERVVSVNPEAHRRALEAASNAARDAGEANRTNTKK